MEQGWLRDGAFHRSSAGGAPPQRLGRSFLNGLEAMTVATLVFIERHGQLLSQWPVRLNAKSCRQKNFLV
jgi:hypothetical protein